MISDNSGGAFEYFRTRESIISERMALLMSMLFLKYDQVDEFIDRCTIALFLRFHDRVEFVEHISGLVFIGRFEHEKVLVKLFNKPDKDWQKQYARYEIDRFVVYKRNYISSKMNRVKDEHTNSLFSEEYKLMKIEPFSYVIRNLFEGNVLLKYGNLVEYCSIPTDINLDTVLYKYKSFPDKNLNTEKLDSKRKEIQDFIDGTLAFSSPCLFNDPFDSDCEIPAIKAILIRISSASGGKYSVDKLTESYLLQLEFWEKASCNNPNLSGINIYEYAFNSLLDIIDPARTWTSFSRGYISIVNDIKELFRILCMTPHYDDILMWGYYGDSGKGLCGGFTRGRIIDGVQRVGNCILIYGKIFYSTTSNQKPKYYNGPIWRYILKCVFTKAGVWRHEDEERFLLLDPRNLDLSKNNHELIKTDRYNGFRGVNSDPNEWRFYTTKDNWPKLKKHPTEFRLIQ